MRFLDKLSERWRRRNLGLGGNFPEKPPQPVPSNRTERRAVIHGSSPKNRAFRLNTMLRRPLVARERRRRSRFERDHIGGR